MTPQEPDHLRNHPHASMRPRLIAVDDRAGKRDHCSRGGASMRPRLIAVDDLKAKP